MAVTRPEPTAGPQTTESSSAPVSSRGWQRDLRAVASYLGAALVAGIVGGFVIGGIGSRLAMLVLRLTTGDSVVGLISDDGFEIGRLSGSTLFLLFFGTALGAAVSILYLLSRPWIPPRFRSPVFGVLGALVGGSGIVHADGIDFRLLEPVWLAVLMFVALPGIGGWAIAALAERLIERRGTGSSLRWWALFVPLLGLAALGPLGIAIALLVPLGIPINQRIPLVRLWTSPPIAWLGRAALGAWAIAAAIALTNDLRGIFG